MNKSDFFGGVDLGEGPFVLPPEFLNFVDEFNTPEELAMSGK